jgi:hypothetical protein
MDLKVLMTLESRRLNNVVQGYQCDWRTASELRAASVYPTPQVLAGSDYLEVGSRIVLPEDQTSCPDL